MYDESHLAGPIDDGDAPRSLAPPAVPDPLQEVRELKRRVQIGVYGTLVAFIPFDAFLIQQSPLELLVNNLLYIVVATIAIEGAFHQMYKLRKQSAYPGVLVMQLGGMESLAAAYQTGLTVLGKLLNLTGSFLCLFQSGSLSPVSLSGVRRLQ